MIIEQIVGHLPWEAGPIVAMCNHRDDVYLACTHAVYRLTPDFFHGDVHVECVRRMPPMPDPI